MKNKLLKTMFLLFALIAGTGSVWADNEAKANDVLWSESFTGGSSSSFSATSDWSECVTPTMLISGDVSQLNYTSDNAMCSTGTAGNVSGANVWLNKQTTGYWAVSGIPLYNAKKVKVSYSQAGASKIIVYYAFDNGSYTLLGNNSTAGSDISTSELDVEGHTTIALKWERTSTKTNVRIDNLKLVATEVSTITVPAITTADVNIGADVLAGNIEYSIENPDGSTLKVTKLSGDWLTVGDVDAENGKVAFTATENTGAARDAVVRLTYGDVAKDVTVSQAAATTKYAVTFSAPVNGTLEIQRTGVAIVSGTEVSSGTQLTIVATPADGYNLDKWEYKTDGDWNEGVGSTYTLTSAVEFRASFVEKVFHTITYSVNGTARKTSVEEGQPISFEAPASGIPAGYAFVGWAETETFTPADSPLATVSSATSTADRTYYAVMAKANVTALTATLTASHTKTNTSYGEHEYTDDKGNKWSGNTNEPYESNVARIGLTNNGSYLESPAFSGNVTDIKIMTYNASSSDRTFNLKSSKDGATADLGTVTAPSKTQLTKEQTANLTETPFNKFYIVASGAVGFSYIAVSYEATTYSGYCTLVPYTRSVTAGKWGTLCLPYDATVEGATLYTFEGVDKTDSPTTAYFEEAASVVGGKPYFFKATDATLTATYSSSEAQEAGSEKGAVGTLTNINVSTGLYLLANNRLVKCGTDCTLAANRAYIDMSSAAVYAGGGAVKMALDMTDGIEIMRSGENEEMRGEVYDLSGRRVRKPAKGLYIVNGKKVVKN